MWERGFSSELCSPIQFWFPCESLSLEKSVPSTTQLQTPPWGRLWGCSLHCLQGPCIFTPASRVGTLDSAAHISWHKPGPLMAISQVDHTLIPWIRRDEAEARDSAPLNKGWKEEGEDPGLQGQNESWCEKLRSLWMKSQPSSVKWKRTFFSLLTENWHLLDIHLCCLWAVGLHLLGLWVKSFTCHTNDKDSFLKSQKQISLAVFWQVRQNVGRYGYISWWDIPLKGNSVN